MATVRAFVAVPLDAGTRAALADAAAALRSSAAALPVSWGAVENFHVTVKFLGAVAEERVPAVAAALATAAAAHRAFTLELVGLGAFPSAGRPRVLWAGIALGGEALAALAADVDVALAKLGFPREDRPFSAHVTLARVREPRRAPELAKALAAATTRRFGSVPVDRIALMQSVLSPKGARYSELESAALTG